MEELVIFLAVCLNISRWEGANNTVGISKKEFVDQKITYSVPFDQKKMYRSRYISSGLINLDLLCAK